MNLKIDTIEFSRALKEYAVYSSRAIPELVNQAGFNITTAASVITYRAKKPAVRAALKASSEVAPGAPIAAILVNYKRGKLGLKGLRGAEMKAKQEELIKLAVGGVNFLRAGWLGAVADFARAIKVNPKQSSANMAERFPKKTGGAKPAPTRGFNVVAHLWNAAFSKVQSTPAGVKHAEEGLRKAMAQDVARMKRRIEMKMQGGINKINRRR